ncbi:unnamed protein product [Linum trigynum]|uniref:Uncharacterized protein n=1 Tax=Linum trigynum TaxID=586398 RepID=A0AAV2G3B0_9ROSI
MTLNFQVRDTVLSLLRQGTNKNAPFSNSNSNIANTNGFLALAHNIVFTEFSAPRYRRASTRCRFSPLPTKNKQKHSFSNNNTNMPSESDLVFP